MEHWQDSGAQALAEDLAELRVRGSGGGGGKGKGGGSGGKDADNTLRSKARVRMIEAISEGEIEGLVNGAKSIYFEQTPLQNPDDSFNFKNVNWTEHKGLPDEGHFPGHAGVETPHQVEVQIRKSVGPVQRTIVDANADAVRLLLRVPALFYQNKSKGVMQTASLSYRIWVRPYGGAWALAVEKDIKNEKCTSPYQIAHRVELPLNGSPWDIRVERVTDDATVIELQNELWWEGYVVIVDGKYIYPHTAAVAMEVNGEDMGNSVPARSYHVRGIKVQVPSNYNVETRTYTGIWDGTFKRSWTNNPAWIFYDLITNDRYGLGEFIRPEIVDKWSLYTIAQYCDQLVPSGYKNTVTGEDVMEPRFTFNGVINTREEAYHVLQSVTTAWRGMAYWSLGQVFATADIPADPIKIVTPANVIGGEFNYSGTALKARHSVVLVKWNDPDDFYQSTIEVVINDAMLRRYGWREKNVTFDGCTSRGLAHRYGKWILDVEQHENETVEYQASWDHAEVRPGDIVAVADPAKAQVRFAGRIRGYDVPAKTVDLDGDFEATPGETYALMAALPAGKLETRAIVGWLNAHTPVLDEPYAEDLLPDAMYAIVGTDIVPRQFRVLSVQEEEKNVFKVTALFHDPLKYARVEQNIVFDPLPYTRPKDISLPPENLKVREVFYQLNGTQRSRILFSWSPNPTAIARSFDVKIITPFDGEINYGETEKTWVELNDVSPGPYTFSVRSRSATKRPSDWVEVEYEAIGPAGIPLPTVTNIRLADRPGTQFVGRDINIAWDNSFAGSSDPTSDDGVLTPGWSPFYKHNTVKIFDVKTGVLLREQETSGPTLLYTHEMNAADATAKGLPSARRAVRLEVTVTDTFDRTSAVATAEFSNLAPAAIVPMTYVTKDQIYFHFATQAQEADFAGFLVWVESGTGFDPLTTPVWTDSADSMIIFPAEPSTTYYCRFAAYDAFGREDLNISPELQIVTAVSGIDLEAPETPAGLALQSHLEGGLAKLVAQWVENTEDDLAGYDIEIKQGSGNWISALTSSTSYEWRVLPGVTYKVRLRAYDLAGNRSPYTSEVEHVVVADTTPPATPTNFSITTGLTSFWLSWTNPAEEDLAYIEVLESETNDEDAAEVIGKTPGASFARTGLENLVQRFYWLRAVDTSGNRSELTAMKSGVTATIPEPKRLQITGLVLTPNAPENNHVEWNIFEIAVGNALQGVNTQTVTAGSAEWSAGSLYIYYVEGETVLRTGTSITDMFLHDGLPIAVYRGGTDLQMADGKVMIDGNTLIAGTVGAQQLVVNDAVITNTLQLKDAVVSSAKIESLSAEKIQANTTISKTVIVEDGDSLGTVADRAADPAARVNAKSTLIEPGKIKVSNTGTLDNWAMGGDSTEINGGALAANTVKANAVVIGMRGITVDGITFEHNSPAVNSVSWSAGTIAYVGDDGAVMTKAIPAGHADWTAGTMFVYWIKDEEQLHVTNNLSIANQDDHVILATYKGGVWLFATYGRTVIDGGQIKTDSIDTMQLKAGAVKADNMDVTSLSAVSTNLGLITAGRAQSDDGKFVIDFTNKFISIEV